MIFAAGLGTRLRPLTNDRPKALVEVGGKSLLAHNLDKLEASGFREIVVNVHYFAEQIVTFVADWGKNAGAKPKDRSRVLISDEREALLETGGGLLLAKDFLAAAPFLVHNVDVLSSLDLAAFYQAHVAKGGLGLLAVRQRPSSRCLLFDRESLVLLGWRNNSTGEEKLARPCRLADTVAYAFSGIAVYDPALFAFMAGREGQKFSIIDILLLAARETDIYAYPHDADRWIDVGRPDSLVAAEAMGFGRR